MRHPASKGFVLALLAALSMATAAHATVRPAKDEESDVVPRGVLRVSAGAEHGDGPGGHTARSITAAIATGLVPGTDITLDGAYVELETPGAARARGWGDPAIQVRSRLLRRSRSGIDLDGTIGVKLPSGDEARGLGTEETDFFSYLHAARGVGAADLHLNVGFTIVGLPEDPHRQADSFLFGAAVTAPIAPRTSLLVDVFQEHLRNVRRNPFATYEDYGTAALAGLRVTAAGATWDAAVFHPLDRPRDIWGITVGLTTSLRLR